MSGPSKIKSTTSLMIPGMIFTMLLCGCTPHAAPASGSADLSVAGFFLGLWHGFIILFTFIISLFRDDMGIYAVHNSGHLYDLGYLLGVMIFFGGSGKGAQRRCD
jgi:hypothetical protein